MNRMIREGDFPKVQLSESEIQKNVERGSSFFHFTQTPSDAVYDAVQLSVVMESFHMEKGRLSVEVYGFPEKYQKGENRFISLSLKLPVREEPHRHNHYEMIWVLEGKANQIFYDHKLELKKNEILLLNQNVEHVDEILGDALICYIQIPKAVVPEILGQETFSQRIQAFFSPDSGDKMETIHFVPRKSEENEAVIYQILDEMMNGYPGSGLIVRGLLCRLLKKIDNGEMFQIEVISERLPNAVRIFKSLERYLESVRWNPGKGETGAYMGYTEQHLSRILLQFTGMTMQKYCVEHKLTYAAELLKSSQMTISDLIAELGYQNKTYFYRTFKEKFGMTPQKYRDQYRDVDESN